VAAIERTAYPRFRHEPNASELRDLFTPAPHEIDFARSLVRSNEHFFAAVLLLKCIQTWAISLNSPRFPLRS
jgi:Domain of unknown function (DUF4158)